MAEKTARVAVSAAVFAIDRPYTYKIPDTLKDTASPGVRVVVPFGKGNRRSEGVVLSVSDETPGGRELKCLDRVLDPEPVLDENQIRLALWMRERFFCTVYDAVHAMLPAGMWYKNGVRRVGDKTVTMATLDVTGEEAAEVAAVKRLRSPKQSAVLNLLSAVGSASIGDIKDFTGASMQTVGALQKQGFLVLEKREVLRRPDTPSRKSAGEIVLSASQQRAFEGLRDMLLQKKAAAALLFGVTGSGKTSVYIRLIRETIAAGRRAILLVPEISLTPQTVALFSAHFGDSVAVLHSSLGAGERLDEWKRIRRGDVKVVIGTRSAVFAPLRDIGLIIIDEEQEHTYKSENAPRYHARDVAQYRCAQSDALLLLGSATPSLESMKAAKDGHFALFELPGRYNVRPLPEVLIADMTEELRSGNGGDLSGLLRRELEKNLSRGEQSILFLNRRGTASLVVCGECGATCDCPNCSVKLTYHANRARLICHYCGYAVPVPAACGDCGGRLKFVGAGTQQIEEELHAAFPDAGILRMDADTVSASNPHEKILREFEEKRVPILIGTQMVAKGLHFENVTLVGVLSADQLMYVGDYRASERAFSLMTQVVGRAGRGKAAGRAVIQTFTPRSELIRLAAQQDYRRFYEREMQFREAAGAPPFSELLTVTVTGTDEERVLTGGGRIARSLKSYLADVEGLRILGPAPAPVMRVMGRYRYRVTLLGRCDRRMRDTVAHVLRLFAADASCRGLAAFADYAPLD